MARRSAATASGFAPPRGHILATRSIHWPTSQQVWIASGDYKLEDDGVVAAFEPVRCDVFVTNRPLALPIYRWRPQAEKRRINAWWRDNAAAGRARCLRLSLGKAQRVIAPSRPLDRADRLPRSGRSDERAHPTGGNRPSADAACRRRRGPRAFAGALPSAYPPPRERLAQALRRLFRRAHRQMNTGSRRPGGDAISTAASRSPITPTGLDC